MKFAVFLAFAVAMLPFSAAAQEGAAGMLGDPARPIPRAQVEEELPEAPEAEEPESPNAPGNAEISDRLRALDSTFSALSANSGTNWGNIILSLVGGAAEAGFGIAFVSLASPGDTIMPALGAYLICLGATTIVRTVVADLILRPDPRGPALEYQHMSSATRAARLARLRYGEQQLNAIADASFTARIVDASLNIAGALAIIPAYLMPRALSAAGLSDFNAFEAFIFVGPALSLVLAVITLVSPTEAEQRRDAYVRMRDRLASNRRAAHPGVSINVSAAGDPRGGGMLLLTGRF